MDKPCPYCLAGRTIDTSRPGIDEEWDGLLDGELPGDRAFAEMARRHPEAVVDCERCGGTGIKP